MKLNDMNNVNEKESYLRSFHNDVCTFHFKVGNELGLNKTKEELYQEVCRINLKYNKH